MENKVLIKLLIKLRYFFAAFAVLAFVYLFPVSSMFIDRSDEVQGGGGWSELPIGPTVPVEEDSGDFPSLDAVIPLTSLALSVLGFLSQFYFNRRADLREERRLRLEESQADEDDK